MKHNEGFTLVELLITIVVGSIAAAAAVTVMILGLRINHRSSEIAQRQNTTRILLTVMERAVTEGTADTISRSENGWALVDQDGGTSLAIMEYSHADNIIKVGGAPMLDHVAASLSLENNLLTLEVQILDDEGNVEENYTTKVFSRTKITEKMPDSLLSLPPDEGEADISSAYAERNYQEVLNFAVESEENTKEVTEFLSVLASQFGSRGQILNEEGQGTGEYFSQWYIGSYEENPDWNTETPWCACYLSWAMAQCNGLAETPRFANVDSFWAEFVTDQNWTASKPVPGDLVFFDWIVDGEYDPQHVGAVIAVADDCIYTIEGNSGNRVAVCRYDLEDPCILGYGQLKWK